MSNGMPKARSVYKYFQSIVIRYNLGRVSAITASEPLIFCTTSKACFVEVQSTKIRRIPKVETAYGNFCRSEFGDKKKTAGICLNPRGLPETNFKGCVNRHKDRFRSIILAITIGCRRK